MDYAQSPLLVTWEVTRACALHCRHCRARAVRRRDPRELTRAEAETVLEQLEAFSPRPTLIITGGDPLEREDLEDILQSAVRRRFSVAVAPSVTPRLTSAVIARWAEMGVRAVSLSLDGASAAVHDGYRGVPGTYAATLRCARAVSASGMRLQINTSLAPATRAELPRLGELVQSLGVASWEIFFVVPTGRARPDEALAPAEQEEALAWLARYRKTVAFRVTAVGAPQFVRHLLEPGVTPAPAVREARGMVFIRHDGAVYPSGYMPLAAGNVRRTAIAEIYRHAPLFRELRDPEKLKGRCRRCVLRAVCGGSRARAWAVAGDPLAEDPNCPGPAGAVAAG